MLTEIYHAMQAAAAESRILSDIYPDAPVIDESHPEMDDTIAHIATLIHMAHTPGQIIDSSRIDANSLSVTQEPDSYDFDYPPFVIARMPADWNDDELPGERDHFHQFVRVAGVEVEIELTVLLRRGRMCVCEVEAEVA